MTVTYTEEGAQQVIYDAMFNAPPCQHWAMSIPCLSCLSKIAADALSSAGRLVPEGWRRDTEWALEEDLGNGNKWQSEPYYRRDHAARRRRIRQYVVRRSLVAAPWTPAEPAQEEYR